MKELLHYPLVKLAIAIVVVFTPIKDALLTAAVLISLDLILGVFAAKKRKEKVRISSAMRRSLNKALMYSLAIMTAFIAQKYLTGELFPICNITTAFVGLAEITSLLENANQLGGGLGPLVKKLNVMKKKEGEICAY